MAVYAYPCCRFPSKLSISIFASFFIHCFSSTAMSFHHSPNMLIACTVKNLLYVFDIQRKALSEWSSDLGQSFPNLTSQSDPIIGISCHPTLPALTCLWGRSFLCFVDFEGPLPTEKKERSGKKRGLDGNEVRILGIGHIISICNYPYTFPFISISFSRTASSSYPVGRRGYSSSQWAVIECIYIYISLSPSFSRTASPCIPLPLFL